MSAVPQSGGDPMQSKRAGLISANDLTYVLEPDLSVAVNKTHKDHFFSADTYKAGSRSIVIVNSGADYIDTRRSYLTFAVQNEAFFTATQATVQTTTVAAAPGFFGDGLGGSKRVQANMFFGTNGSACNLIETVTISTRSGDELSRIDDFNAFQNMMIPLTYDDEWLDTVGQAMGFGQGVPSRYSIPAADRITPVQVALTKREVRAPTASGNGTAGGVFEDVLRPPTRQTNKLLWGKDDAVKVFAIPLYVLSPLFQYGRLMPSMLMSGLRIEIKWAPAVTACQFCPVDRSIFERGNQAIINKGAYLEKATGKTPDSTNYTNAGNDHSFTLTDTDVGFAVLDNADYSIVKPKLTLCSVQLSDAIQRALNEQSAVNGLEIVFADYDNQVHMGKSLDENDESFNIEIRKSCSRALKAYCRSTYGSNKWDYLRDSLMAEQNFPWVKYQWRLGSLYFPQQALEAKTARELTPVAYCNTLDAVNKYSGKQCHLPLYGKKGTIEKYTLPEPMPTHLVRVQGADPQQQFGLFDHTYGFEGSNCQRAHYIAGTLSGNFNGSYRWSRTVAQDNDNGGFTTEQVTMGAEFQERTGRGEQDHGYISTIGRPGSFSADSHVLAVDLERSTMFNLAGIPINNSRVLAFTGTCKNTANVERFGFYKTEDKHLFKSVHRMVRVYLKYVKLARVWLNNVEVEQ